MKLILASDMSFLLEHGYDLTGISKEKIKVGYVITASKVEPDQSFLEKLKSIIRNAGIYFETIDIEGKTEQEIRNFFQDKNIIHVEGGNIFYLLKVIRETGFEKILRELINEGKVYIGTSAGAYIMCPTIEVSSWDELDNRFDVTDFSALNYVPFVLNVHYEDKSETKVKEKMKTLKYPLRILRDGEGILVEDSKYTFVSDKLETKLE